MDNAQDAVNEIRELIKRLSALNGAIEANDGSGQGVVNDLGVDLDGMLMEVDQLFDTPEEAEKMFSDKAAQEEKKLADGLLNYITGE